MTEDERKQRLALPAVNLGEYDSASWSEDLKKLEPKPPKPRVSIAKLIEKLPPPKVKLGRRPAEVQPRHREIAKRVLRKGQSLLRALTDCGFSETQARKGLVIIRQNNALRTAFADEAEAMRQEKKDRPITPDWGTIEGDIIHRLHENVLDGKDKAVMSAKVLGSHKKLNLWQPEFQQGIVILNAPGPGASMLPLTPQIPDDPE